MRIHPQGVIGFNLSYLFDSVELFTECVREGQQLIDAGHVRPPKISEYK